jgi:hypothetical protein
MFFPWAFEAATRPNLLDQVENILGPDILLWGTLILSKNPDSRSFVPWHQDSGLFRCEIWEERADRVSVAHYAVESV